MMEEKNMKSTMNDAVDEDEDQKLRAELKYLIDENIRLANVVEELQQLLDNQERSA